MDSYVYFFGLSFKKKSNDWDLRPLISKVFIKFLGQMLVFINSWNLKLGIYLAFFDWDLRPLIKLNYFMSFSVPLLKKINIVKTIELHNKAMIHYYEWKVKSQRLSRATAFFYLFLKVIIMSIPVILMYYTKRHPWNEILEIDKFVCWKKINFNYVINILIYRVT